MIEIPGYTVLRLLGQGGMATVYLALQQSLSREVALKVLSPALTLDSVATERFLREARVSAKLHHPNIVAIHDVGVHNGLPYMSIAYEPGGTVAQASHARGDPPVAMRMVRDIANALDYAHSQGVVHRDVKPENILLRKDGTCVLSDFGIAHAIEIKAGLTREGTSVGTPHYMSPEQLRGESVDGRTDLYSLGVVFYQLLTGDLPYQGTDGWAIGIQHISAPIPRLPAHLSQLQSFLDSMLAKEPGRRPQTGADVVKWVDARLSGRMASMTVPVSKIAPVEGSPRSSPSIAILPFEDMSQGKDQQYLADGLSEELLNLLSKVRGLHVASRSSAFSFKGKSAKLVDIGRELKVATVLEGSVRKFGERVRISIQLINVADGFQMWSETYDRQLTDVFAVQDEIAELVVTALKLELLPTQATMSRVDTAEAELKSAQEAQARETADRAAAEMRQRAAAEEAAIEAQQRAAAEKAATEARLREAAEKSGAEARQREAGEKAAADARQREAAEKAVIETRQREVAEKAAAEARQREAAERAAAEARQRAADERVAAAEARLREAEDKAAAAEARQLEAAEKAAAEARQREAAEKDAAEARQRAAAEKAAAEARQREAEEKAAVEVRKRQAAEKLAAEARLRESTEKAAADARQREAAEKAAADARQRDAAEKAAAEARQHAAEERAAAAEARQREAEEKAGAAEARHKEAAEKAAAEARQREAAERDAAEARQRAAVAAERAAAEARKREEAEKLAAQRAAAEQSEIAARKRAATDAQRTAATAATGVAAQARDKETPPTRRAVFTPLRAAVAVAVVLGLGWLVSAQFREHQDGQVAIRSDQTVAKPSAVAKTEEARKKNADSVAAQPAPVEPSTPPSRPPAGPASKDIPSASVKSTDTAKIDKPATAAPARAKPAATTPSPALSDKALASSVRPPTLDVSKLANPASQLSPDAAVESAQEQAAAIMPTIVPQPAPAAPILPDRPEAAPSALVPLNTPQPAYPAKARRGWVMGSVTASFTVNRDGSVSNVQVLSAYPFGVFDANVVSTVSGWKFQPIDEPRNTTRTFTFKP